MTYLWWYIYLSLGMGLVLTVIELFFTKEGRIDKPLDREQDRGMQKAVEDGHIQKETFRDKIIYHPITDEGRVEFMATEVAEKIYNTYKPIYLLIGFVMLIVIWPYELYSLTRYYAD